MRVHILSHGSANHSKGQIANIFGFAGHPVFVTDIQLCHCSMKAAIDNM